MKVSIQKVVVIAVMLVFTACLYGLTKVTLPKETRKVISLNGSWQVEEGTMDKVPEMFGHSVEVPGFVDMSTPAFVEPGPKVKEREAPSLKKI